MLRVCYGFVGITNILILTVRGSILKRIYTVLGLQGSSQFSVARISDRICPWARILVQVTINRRLLIGRDGDLDQSEAYDLS